MAQELTILKESPSQTAGPYVHIGATPNWAEITGLWREDLGLALVGPETKGERIIVRGRVFDGGGAPLKDALVEIWQADARGLYNSPEETRGGADPHFAGWGRRPTDGATGEYRFETIKPGRAPYRDGRPMAPHINFLDRGAGHQYRAAHAHVFRRRGGGQCGMPGAGAHRAQAARADPDRPAGRGERDARLHLRHSPPGRERNRLLRYLMAT